MPKISWSSEEFRNPQDSTGTSTEKISGGGLEQGYKHGSLTRGLVAYYPMDSGSGDTLTDEVLGYDGSINGASWTTDSKIGEACLSFDGTDDYVDMGVLPLSGGLTVSCWINASEFTGSEQQMIVGNYNGGSSSQHYQVRLLDDGFEWVIDDGSTGTFANVSTVTLDTWYHLVGVYRPSDSSMKAYINGVKQLDRDYSGSTPNFQTASTRLGTRSDENNWNFHGKIDDVRIYDRPLSTPEIQALYNLERPSKISSGDTLQ